MARRLRRPHDSWKLCSRMRDRLAERGCEWTFNIERTPWWGRAFERMVQSTKRCLRKMVGQASLTQDELVSTVAEIESIINSRPLSYISAEDTEEPLTPSHLFIGRRVLNLPEYLAELRESHKQLLKKAQGNPQVSVGDVVIVYEKGLPRGFWKLGRIKRLIVERDGQTRGATVEIAGKKLPLNRPLRLLYPLEIDQSSECESTPRELLEMQESETEDKLEDRPSPQSRPRRSAAKRDEKRKLWTRELQDSI